MYYGITDTIFTEYLRTLGVRTYPGNGTNKVAYEAIKCELNVRNWCDVDCILTGIDNVIIENGVNIFPNPAKDFLNIKSVSDIQSLEIYNQTGILMTRYEIVNTIDVSGFSSGMYFIRIQFTNGREVKRKFIKEFPMRLKCKNT